MLNRELVQVLLYCGSMSGHRRSYATFVGKLLNARLAGVWEISTTRLPVLFLMIEDSFSLYVLISVFRAIAGRRTTGLLFRARQATHGKTFRLRIKRLFLLALKRIQPIRTLTILPFTTDHNYSKIADDWIHDFQLWDISKEALMYTAEQRRNPDDPFLISIRKAAAGKPVVCALGAQDAHKGFDVFARTYVENENIRKAFLFIFGGKVRDVFSRLVEEFEKIGGCAQDRFISDIELQNFYSASDLAWCFYSPDYDQASGIFGRAVQFGIPVLVREGSSIDKMCKIYDIPHIAANARNIVSIAEITIPHVNSEYGKFLAARFRAESLERLMGSLGILSNIRDFHG